MPTLSTSIRADLATYTLFKFCQIKTLIKISQRHHSWLKGKNGVWLNRVTLVVCELIMNLGQVFIKINTVTILTIKKC